jgi:hypothetical protein
MVSRSYAYCNFTPCLFCASLEVSQDMPPQNEIKT